MRLTEILSPECVCVPLVAADKQSAIFELVDVLADHAQIEDHDELKQKVWEREQIRTTGIGHGLAVPHGRCNGAQRLLMAVGRTESPLEFNAIDRQPVELIFLLASPVDQTGPHIQALATISRVLTDPEVRASFKQARSADELYELIRQHDVG